MCLGEEGDGNSNQEWMVVASFATMRQGPGTRLQGLVQVEAPDEAALLLLGQGHLEEGALGVEPVGALGGVVVVGMIKLDGFVNLLS